MDILPLSLFSPIQELRVGITLGMPYDELKKIIESFEKTRIAYGEEILKIRGKSEDGEIYTYITWIELFLIDIRKILDRIKEGMPYEQYIKSMEFLWKELKRIKDKGVKLILKQK